MIATTALVAAVLVVTFFALTRTEVGREALRQQIEHRFAQRYDGRLTIGRLSGNLVHDVFASDVRLYDGTGRRVASIDSIVIRPHWRDLLDRSLSSGRVYLFRPRLHLTFDEDGPNVARIFRRASEAVEEVTPWSFRSADVRVIDGEVTTTNEGWLDPSIDRGLIFDYSRARVATINGRALVESDDGETLLNIRSLSMKAVEPNVHVHQVRGQLLLDRERIALRSVDVAAAGSEAELWADVPINTSASRSSQEVELTLRNAVVDNDSLRILFPALPLTDLARIDVAVRGTLGSLELDHVRIQRGSSSVEVSGSLRGLPERLDYDLAISRSRLHPGDLSALVPDLDTSDYLYVGIVDGDVEVRGSATLGSDRRINALDAEGEVALRSDAGRVSGPFHLSLETSGTLRIDADIDARNLRPGVFASRLHPDTRLTGRFTIDGQYSSADGFHGDAATYLGQSLVEGQQIDTLAIEGRIAGNRLSARGIGRQGEAAVVATGTLHDEDFRVHLAVSDLDAGRWWLKGDSVRTRLDGRVTVEGTGLRLADLNGRITAEIEDSWIWHHGVRSRIPAHRHVAELSQRDGRPRLSVSGDVLDLELQSDAPVAAVATAAEQWRTALEGIFNGTSSRNLRPETDSLAVVSSVAARAPAEDFEPVHVTLDASVVDSRILAIIYDDLAGIRTDAVLSADIRADTDRLVAGLVIQADSFHTGTTRVAGYRSMVHLAARGKTGGGLRHDVQVEAGAASVHLAGEEFRDPRALLSLSEGRGHLELASAGDSEHERLDFLASIESDSSKRRLHLERLMISAASYEWSLQGQPTIDIFDDAVVIRALKLESISGRTVQPQYLQLEGVVSAHPDDTLRARIADVRVGDLAEMLGVRIPLAGIANGDVALTGMFNRPELTGRVDVDRFVFDDRPLGRVSLQSMYVAGRPDIMLDARVTPLGDSEGAVPHERIPAGPTHNDVRLFGNVRLPTLGPDGRMADPGRLDLALTAAHADAFFFDYIFREIDDARGVLHGDGSIRGDFRRPVFEARLRLVDGGMRIPDFNLAYDVAGAVVVDSSAIRLQSVRVSDATGGEAVVDGDILFNAYRFFSFDLRAELNDTQFMNVLASREMGFYGDVRASGNVTLTGPLNRATLTSSDASIHPDSRIYIAIMEESGAVDTGFIVFADSTGRLPDLARVRTNVLAQRPPGERLFVDGLEMDLNILARQGTNLHLVIDPVLGDVINASASGRIQLQRSEGDYMAFGSLEIDAGDYLFTAGDVFVRRFLIDGGTIAWDGDPANAVMNIQASYRTRASAAGLNIAASDRTRIPLIVRLDITGRVAAPTVGLRLLIDRDTRETITAYESLESILNQPERSAEYATSVMLTNSFLLTTTIASSGDVALSTTRNQLAFNSLSQLVATQLNRYLSHALPNVDVSLGLQGESTQDLDVTYGVALRLLDERLVIRGHGLYQNEAYRSVQQNLLDEFVVEVRLSSAVSVEVFYRRENDILGSDHALANTTGAGLSYETQFASWSRLVDRLLRRNPHRPDDDRSDDVLAGADEEPADARVDK